MKKIYAMQCTVYDTEQTPENKIVKQFWMLCQPGETLGTDDKLWGEDEQWHHWKTVHSDNLRQWETKEEAEAYIAVYEELRNMTKTTSSNVEGSNPVEHVDDWYVPSECGAYTFIHGTADRWYIIRNAPFPTHGKDDLERNYFVFATLESAQHYLTGYLARMQKKPIQAPPELRMSLMKEQAKALVSQVRSYDQDLRHIYMFEDKALAVAFQNQRFPMPPAHGTHRAATQRLRSLLDTSIEGWRPNKKFLLDSEFLLVYQTLSIHPITMGTAKYYIVEGTKFAFKSKIDGETSYSDATKFMIFRDSDAKYLGNDYKWYDWANSVEPEDCAGNQDEIFIFDSKEEAMQDWEQYKKLSQDVELERYMYRQVEQAIEHVDKAEEVSIILDGTEEEEEEVEVPSSHHQLLRSSLMKEQAKSLMQQVVALRRRDTTTSIPHCNEGELIKCHD